MSITMNFINLSKFDFTSKCNFLEEPGLKTHSQVPGRVMAAMHGNETLEVKQEFMSWYVDGHNEASVIWYPNTDASGNYDLANCFGIKVHVPLQFLGMGPAPRWSPGHYFNMKLMNQGFAGFLWLDVSDDDQPKKYTFTGLKGYSVDVDPVCEHSAITVKVTIRTATN